MQEFQLLKTFLVELLEGVKASGGYDRAEPDEKPEIIAHAERVLGPALVPLGEEPRFELATKWLIPALPGLYR